ncbi:MAG: hypothetical protein HY719_17390 [Planctomycetes bacterium]|nr:hypothetical protein [Planctomycetota bacterium]
MSVADRDFSRFMDDAQPAFTVRGRLTPVVRGALLTLFVAFATQFAFMLVDDDLEPAARFSPRRWWSAGGWWTVGTALCVFPRAFLGVAAGLVAAFWLFGREVEARLGGRSLLGLLLFSGVLGLSPALLDPEGWSLGPVAPVFAVLFMFFFAVRDLVVFEALPARWLAMLAAVGLAVATLVSGAQGVSPLTPAIGGGAAWWWWHARSQGLMRRRMREEQSLAEEREEALSTRLRVDALLDKINALGIDRLSEEERRFLAAASRRFRRAGRR